MAGTETGSGTGTRRDAEGTGSFERMVGMAPAFAYGFAYCALASSGASATGTDNVFFFSCVYGENRSTRQKFSLSNISISKAQSD